VRFNRKITERDVKTALFRGPVHIYTAGLDRQRGMRVALILPAQGAPIFMTIKKGAPVGAYPLTTMRRGGVLARFSAVIPRWAPASAEQLVQAPLKNSFRKGPLAVAGKSARAVAG
jgi:hypothetical protein